MPFAGLGQIPGLRVIIVFEGRDAAGKGGTIKAIAERVSPCGFRLVALPAPSDREKTQMFMRRYIRQFPAAGEVVIFDRSWYNRAGVKSVMGFVAKSEHRKFRDLCPEIEGYIVDGKVKLPQRSTKHKYDDERSLRGQKVVAEKY